MLNFTPGEEVNHVSQGNNTTSIQLTFKNDTKSLGKTSINSNLLGTPGQVKLRREYLNEPGTGTAANLSNLLKKHLKVFRMILIQYYLMIQSPNGVT